MEQEDSTDEQLTPQALHDCIFDDKNAGADTLAVALINRLPAAPRIKGAHHKDAKELVMRFPTIRTNLRRIRSMLKRDPDSFLREVSGVIHVGANTGQEKELYEKFGL